MTGSVESAALAAEVQQGFGDRAMGLPFHEFTAALAEVGGAIVTIGEPQVPGRMLAANELTDAQP